MNVREPTTNLPTKTIANALQRVFSEEEVDQIARDTGLMKRKRKISPLALVVACLSTLGTAKAQWLADILRTLNRFTGKGVRYKPFHNQLAKPGFAQFLQELVCKALDELTVPVLRAMPGSRLEKFEDIIMHDGTSFRLKDDLAKNWPGRFRQQAPAAMEIHATLSATEDNVVRLVIAPDKEAELPLLPNRDEVRNRLLLGDRGYESREAFSEIDQHEGFFIIRGKLNIKPIIQRAYQSRRRVKRLEGKPLNLRSLPKENMDLDIEWGKGNKLWRGRLVILHIEGKRNTKSRLLLHTNLKRSEFPWWEVALLYRLRWQVELIFKEWKSHCNLHRFDTSKDPIAEGLVWASLLVAILKRFLCHAAQRNTGVELSTQRAASSARHFLDDVLRAFLIGRRALTSALRSALDFLARNAQRAHPARDRHRGRLASGLRPIGVA